MKKVYGLLIILSALCLLDGTPIHNHHGKYIAVRSRATFHESDQFQAIAFADQINIFDDATDQQDFGISGGNFVIIGRHQYVAAVRKSIVLSRNGAPGIPLYQMACDYRI